MVATDTIMWSVRFRNKQVKRFKFPIRTIPEGTLETDGGFGPGSGDLKSQELRTEPDSLGTDLYKK